MKFSKGLLSEEAEAKRRAAEAKEAEPPAPPPPSETRPIIVEKDRLFETVEKTRGSSRKYLTLLGLFAVVVAAGGAIAWLVNRPGPGDPVRVPAAMEMALRDHFLVNEKRTATDVSFFLCEGFHWARVGVETRTDMPNPLLRIPFYQARITPSGESWTIEARPVTSPELDVPCR